MIGGGIAAAVGGGWTIATVVIDYQKDKPSPSSSIVVEQKSIGIASGHSNAKDITAPILEQIEKLDGRQKETAAQIARKKGVEIPPLLAVLVKMGEKGVKVEDIPKLLDAKANGLIKLHSELDLLRKGPAELAAIAQEAQSLIDKGELAAASQALAGGRKAARKAARAQKSMRTATRRKSWFSTRASTISSSPIDRQPAKMAKPRPLSLPSIP